MPLFDQTATLDSGGHIPAAQLPAATTLAQGAVILDGTAGDIQPLGAQAAGGKGQAADAKHVHPATGLVTSVTAADVSVVTGGTNTAPTVAAQLDRRQTGKYSGMSGQVPRESIPFYNATGAVTAPAGVMLLTILPVIPGDVITNLGFITNTTAATFGSSGYHWWVALYDSAAANFIAQSADKTNTAIAANTAYMLPLQSPAPYTVPPAVTELYAAVMVNVGTGGSPVNPTLRGSSLTTALFDSTTSLFPTSRIYAATNGSGIGATAPAGPLTLAAGANAVYFGAD